MGDSFANVGLNGGILGVFTLRGKGIPGGRFITIALLFARVQAPRPKRQDVVG